MANTVGFGGASKPVAPRADPALSSFSSMNGGVMSGIADIARSAERGTAKLAAGFSKDPAVRGRYQSVIAQQEAQSEADRQTKTRERIAALMGNYALYAQAAQQAGQIPPVVAQAMESDGALLQELGVPAEMVKSAANIVGLYAQTPVGSDPYTLSPGQTRFGPDGKPVASVPAEPPAANETALRLRAQGGQTGIPSVDALSPGQAASALRAGQAPTAPLPVGVINLRLPDGSIRGFDTRDGNSIRAALASGAVEAGVQSQGMGGAQTEAGLRDEFTKLNKEFVQAQTGYQKVQAAADNPSAAGDISLIFGYMKLLDPTSTVREGEFATAEQAGGVPQQIVSMYNRAINGERLAPEVRADFANQARTVFNVYSQQYERNKQYYTDLATRSGANPQNVIVPFAAPAPAPAPVQNPSGAPTNNPGMSGMSTPGAQPPTRLRYDPATNSLSPVR